MTKGLTFAVALLADAPALVPRLSVVRSLPHDTTASQIGFATAALLCVGILLSIATTPDALWWQLHFSRLGTFAVFSSYVFNATIVLTSAGVVLFAYGLRREMVRHSGTPALINRRAATVVPILVALLGIHLSFVGFFPVNTNEFVHDRGSTGAVFSFVAILASSRWMLRGMHRIIGRASRFVGIAIGATVAPYIGGFINLAAFELIVFCLIFGWLLLFARTIGRADDAPVRPTPTRTASMNRTVVVAPHARREHVPVAARDLTPSHSGVRAATRPGGAEHARRPGRVRAAGRPDAAHHRVRGGRTVLDGT